MAGIRFLLDEQLRGELWQACRKHNEEQIDLRIDFVRVGDPGAPPAGSADPDILLWAEANDRLLVSRDKKTMPHHLKRHWASGHSIPGVILLRPKDTLVSVLEYMVTIAHVTDASEWTDQVEYII